MMRTDLLLDLSVIPYSSRIIVGVSGGTDSVCLLHLLSGFKHELALEIIVAHYDHALRPNSAKDAEFVSKLAASLKLDFITERNDLTCPRKVSIEEFARQQRFNFFIKAAVKSKAEAVVLAHTQDDLAETVLMRILRGTGLCGLRSILPSRQMNNILFLRPLLNTKRTDLEKYLKAIKANHIDDPTNAEDIYLRNRIRHTLIPYIQKNFSTAIKEKLAQLSINATIDYDVLELELYKAWSKVAVTKNKEVIIYLTGWKALPQPIRRMVLREAAQRILGRSGGISFSHITMIESLVKKHVTNKNISCSAGLEIKITRKPELCLKFSLTKIARAAKTATVNQAVSYGKMQNKFISLS
ncbi:MAG: tRNA lysidine(34) synthetase TilS [Candidatus Omnitrophota bacterium]